MGFSIKKTDIGIVCLAVLTAGFLLKRSFAKDIAVAGDSTMLSAQSDTGKDSINHQGVKENRDHPIQDTNRRDVLSNDWESARASRTEKMEEWVKLNGRWEAYETYLKKYTSLDWVRSQFPTYGPDSLELARRMLMQQAALMAMMYTPAEVEDFRKRGVDIEKYFVKRHDPLRTEGLLVRSEVVVVLRPLFTQVQKLKDGFQSNGVYVVRETIKGSHEVGDTLYIRLRGASQKSSSVLAYLTRSGGMQFTSGQGAIPVSLPSNYYYARVLLDLNGEEIIRQGFIAQSHVGTLTEVRELARLFQ